MRDPIRDPIRHVELADVWTTPAAEEFFRNVWPMYVHELSGFGADFYTLDARGRWQPEIVDDWAAPVTLDELLRETRSESDPRQPFQRAHVVLGDGVPVGFVCVSVSPFRFMAPDVDFELGEMFLVHTHRGAGVAERALGEVLSRYPGRWCLRVLPGNARAIRFWQRALPLTGARDLRHAEGDADVVWRFVVGEG